MKAQILQDIQSLTATLDELATTKLLTELAKHPELFADHQIFDDTGYRRNRVIRTELVDLLVLCWKPGQRTPIHDHTGSVCGVCILRGEGTEVTFTRSGVDLLMPCKSQIFTAGEITTSRDADIHLMGNFASSNTDLVTLHCYSPPLQEMKLYEVSKTFLANDQEITWHATKTSCYRPTV
jgi:predicted metal-dependent enzyme (double-stranded beta helix superfamily)